MCLKRSLMIGLAASLVSSCGKSEVGSKTPSPGPDLEAASAPDAESSATAPTRTAPTGLAERSPAEAWTGAPLRLMVTDVVARKVGKATKLIIEILVLDEKGQAVTTLEPGDLALTLDGLYVPGTWDVRKFSESGRAVALALLVPTHSAYFQPLDPDNGLTWRPMDGAIAGAKQLLEGLSEQDRVMVFGLNEDELKVVSPWTTPASSLDVFHKLPPISDRPQVSPALYRALSKVMQRFIEDAHDLPARRVMLAVTDGADPGLHRPDLISRRIDEIHELAAQANVAPWIVGFTPAATEPLVNLKALGSKSNGRYLEVAFDDHPNLGERIASFGAAVRKGFVLTLTPAEGVRLPQKASEVGLALRAAGGVGRTLHGELDLR